MCWFLTRYWDWRTLQLQYVLKCLPPHLQWRHDLQLNLGQWRPKLNHELKLYWESDLCWIMIWNTNRWQTLLKIGFISFFTSWIEIWKKTTNSTENWIYAESWFETQKQMTNSPKDWIYFFFYIALRETWQFDVCLASGDAFHCWSSWKAWRRANISKLKKNRTSKVWRVLYENKGALILLLPKWSSDIRKIFLAGF